MQALALSGDGNYYFIEHPSDLPRIFAAELSGLNNTFARTVSLGFETDNGVKVLDVLNDIARNEHGRLMLPNLMFGGTLEVLVKLSLPKGQSLEALRVRLAYSPANGAQRQVKRETLQLRGVSDAEYRSQTAHPSVLEALALLEVARAKVEMVKKLDQGEDNDAANLLQAQSAALAAAPASPKILKEMAVIEDLKRELTQDRTVTRKRASSQVYEKQRGY
jgi:Ca-activated chloride channel homolog